MSLNLIIKTPSSRFEVAVDSSLTVAELKQRLVTQSGFEVHEQRLVYSGRILADERTLDDYELKSGHQINLVKIASNNLRNQTSAQSQSPTRPSTAPLGFGGDTGLGAFGTGGMGGASGLMENPELMRQMMNSPMMQGLLNNPEMLRSMMMANPQVRQLMETNPEIGQMMSDPQFLRQVMDMARNPELSREMRRNADRAIANLEAIPGGFNHLQRMYNQIQAPLESAFTPGQQSDTEEANRRLAEELRVQEVQQGELNNAALPNPWGPRPQQQSHNDPMTSSVTNPFASMLQGRSGSNPFMGQSASPTNLTSQPSQPAQSTPAPFPFTMPSATSNPAQQNPFAMMFQRMNDPAYMAQMQQMQAAMMNNPMYQERMRQMMAMFGGQGMQLPGASTDSATTGGQPTNWMENYMRMLNPTASTTTQLSTTAPSQPSETLEQRYSSQLQQMVDMGFERNQALQALGLTGGNLEAAINWIVGRQ